MQMMFLLIPLEKHSIFALEDLSHSRELLWSYIVS